MLTQFCNEDHSIINYQKTKIMAFVERPKTSVWSINGHKTEQVTSFKYLLHDSGLKKSYCDYVASARQKYSHNIINFISG